MESLPRLWEECSGCFISVTYPVVGHLMWYNLTTLSVVSAILKSSAMEWKMSGIPLKIRIRMGIGGSDDIGWVILKWGWRGGAGLRWARACSHIKNTKARDFSDPWAEGRGSEMGSLVGPERNYRWHWEKTTEIFQHLILHRWVNNASGLQP